jgi:hypothetical protein
MYLHDRFSKPFCKRSPVFKSNLILLAAEGLDPATSAWLTACFVEEGLTRMTTHARLSDINQRESL